MLVVLIRVDFSHEVFHISFIAILCFTICVIPMFQRSRRIMPWP